MVIDWEKGKHNIRAPHLLYLLDEIRSLRSSFELVSFSHIYKEINSEAHLLSKMTLEIQPEIIEVEEHKNGQVIESFTMI